MFSIKKMGSAVVTATKATGHGIAVASKAVVTTDLAEIGHGIKVGTLATGRGIKGGTLATGRSVKNVPTKVQEFRSNRAEYKAANADDVIIDAEVIEVVDVAEEAIKVAKRAAQAHKSHVKASAAKKAAPKANTTA